MVTSRKEPEQGTGKEKREPLRPRRLGAGAGAGAGEGRGARLPGREPPSLPSRPLCLSAREVRRTSGPVTGR